MRNGDFMLVQETNKKRITKIDRDDFLILTSLVLLGPSVSILVAVFLSGHSSIFS